MKTFLKYFYASFRKGSMVLSMVLMVPSAMAVVFYLIWQVSASGRIYIFHSLFKTWQICFFQTYILRLEVILCGMTLAMFGLHLVFSLVSTITFTTV